MKRRLRLVINVDVVDLSEEEKLDAQEMMLYGADDIPVEIPTLKDYIEEEEEGFTSIRNELASILEGSLEPNMCREMFAGSDIYITFDNATVVETKWIGELED